MDIVAIIKGNKTVDGVMVAFKNAIQDLREVENHHLAKISVNNEKIADLAEEAATSDAEAKRAARVRAKLEELILL